MRHVPRLVQFAGHGTAISQPAPSKPGLHAHTELGRQSPWPEQSRTQRARSLQLAPVKPGVQMHTPLAREQLPWPEQTAPPRPAGHST